MNKFYLSESRLNGKYWLDNGKYQYCFDTLKEALNEMRLLNG